MIEDRPLELRPVLVNEAEARVAREALRVHDRLAPTGNPYLTSAEAALLRSLVAQFDQGGK